ncbi:MAG: serine hydrolase, partial [Bacteroidota bacterium]|nr:serine hydrolase [Bacteroidota bacterium]
MKKVVLYALGTAFAMFLWAAVIFLGTLNGWLHQPITKRNTAPDFIAATEAEIDKQFVGNFALA